jgi:hypothetical protein
MRDENRKSSTDISPIQISLDSPIDPRPTVLGRFKDDLNVAVFLIEDARLQLGGRM